MPSIRLRRLRKNEYIRDWVSEALLRPKDLILPYFVTEGKGVKKSIPSMSGIYQFSSDNLVKDMEGLNSLGIKAILLFGICSRKDEKGREAYSKNGVVQKALKKIRKNIKDIVIITDVCLCGYTSHGHCGIVKNQNFYIDNDTTLKTLAKIALSHAEAGADFVAPSAMMDGQVRSIREALDKNGFKETGILAYSAKYASSFYGPFRDAMDSSPQFGNRKSYQMDFRNSDEALKEIGNDIEEGADIVMVKPALAYLDIIYRTREKFNVPIAAYNVSGEYALVKGQGSRVKGQEEKNMVLEILTGIKRAGANFIITYHAKEVARWLKR